MRAALLLFLALVGTGCRAGTGGTRAQISAVGSSTVFPFTATVAERFVALHPDARAPVVESTGTGAGIRLFCSGVGAAWPDLVDASRRMTAGEYRRCRERGAGAVLELQVGLDGIVFAETRDGPALSLTPAALYRALAAEPGGRPNATRTWADVDPRFPATPIIIYGPPATSGTRDALADLILLPGCLAADPAAGRLPPGARVVRCTRLREDGVYVDTGENDNFAVQKLQADRQALAIFGYGYLRENAAYVRGLPIDGVAPTYATIAERRYPGARPLYVYAKAGHLDAVPGLRAFLRLYAASWGPDGPLVRHGLIAAPPVVRARMAAAVAAETPLDPADLRR